MICLGDVSILYVILPVAALRAAFLLFSNTYKNISEKISKKVD